jgi:hypothetical protein
MTASPAILYVEENVEEDTPEDTPEDALDELVAAMPADSRSFMSREALASLLAQVGQIRNEHEQDKILRERVSRDLTNLARDQVIIKSRLVQVERQIGNAVSMFPGAMSSTPPPEAKIVGPADTLGALLEGYVVEDSPTGVHTVYKIDKKELNIRRFTQLQAEAEERASRKRWKKIKEWVKSHVAKGAGHAVAHSVSLAVGAAIIYLLHYLGKL